MRKFFLLLTILCASSFMKAQNIPTPVYKLDFEGATSVADFGGVQHGDGELRVSEDSNFGTYYQNAPNETTAASHTNYLVVTQDAFQKVAEKTDGGMSIGVWVNAYEANKKTIDNGLNPYYQWSPMFSAWSSTKAEGSWMPPLMVFNTRLWMQINTDWIWCDFTNEEHVDGQYIIDNSWLQNRINPATGEEYGFDDNWHFVTVVFSDYSSNVKIYTDGELRNEWNCRDGFKGAANFFSHLYKFDNVYLGGCSQWDWLDPDPALAYDDFMVYAEEISSEQISLIMGMKLGTFTPEQKLTIAKSQFTNDADNLSIYGAILMDDGFTDLGQYLYDYTVEYEVSEETVEAYNKGSEDMKSKLEWAKNLIGNYNKFSTKIERLKNFGESTNYPGLSVLVSTLDKVLPAKESFISETSIEGADVAIENAKKDYLFSQVIPTDGSGIVVSKMIQHPWFCDDDAEPILGNDGIAVYSVPNPAERLNSTGWVNTVSESLFGNTDCTMYFAQGRTTWNNWHQSNVVGGELNIHQLLVSLPQGYYTISADLVSNTDATDTHVYAITGDGYKGISPTFSGNGWDGLGSGLGKWETLTTGKVLVGEDGNLTIGALATTNGKPYLGWYCATNFVLRYYGTNVDISKELAAKKTEAQTLISTLVLKGDRANANEILDSILNSGASDYEKMGGITVLVKEVTEWKKVEDGFTGISDLAAYKSKESDAVVIGIVTTVEGQMSTMWSGEQTTYLDVPQMKETCIECMFYADVVKHAQKWNEKAVSDLVTSQVSSLSKSPATKDILLGYSEDLRNAMKFGITKKGASKESPVDVSFLIKNASFTGNSSAYWEGSQPTIDYNEAEFYNVNFNIYQVLGNMPKGIYRLEAKGFYRDGTNEVAYANYPQATMRNAILYINEGGSALQPWASDSVLDEPFEANDFSVNDIGYFTNSMKSAAQYIAIGLFNDNHANYELVQDGDLTIGLRKTSGIVSDWALFDDFCLYYLGESSEKPQTDDYFVTVGEKDNTSYPFWTQFSDYYTLKSGNIAHFQFVNYSDMVNFYDNWLLAAVNRPDHNTGAYPDYREYFIIRADWYGWGELYTTGTLSHNFVPETFKQDMNGAFVDMYVSFRNGTVNMTSKITTNSENEDVTTHKVYDYSFTGVTGISDDEIILYFTVDHANLQGFVPTDITDINVVGPQTDGTIYNLSGQVVDNSYKGVVIKNGKKHLNK